MPQNLHYHQNMAIVMTIKLFALFCFENKAKSLHIYSFLLIHQHVLYFEQPPD